MFCKHVINGKTFGLIKIKGRQYKKGQHKISAKIINGDDGIFGVRVKTRVMVKGVGVIFL